MGTLSELAGRRVYLDTNCIIYAAEYDPGTVPDNLENEALKNAVSSAHKIMLAIDRRAFTAVTGEMTLAEVLVGALRDKRVHLAAWYRRFLSDAGALEMLPVSRDVWELSAQLRSDCLVRQQSLLMPDAVQLATAITGRCEVFVCNDRL